MRLDVSILHRKALYSIGNNSCWLENIVSSAKESIRQLASATLIKANNSFGFALGDAVQETNQKNWDNPYEFVWFVTGWGPDANRYIANAVRKLRPALRTGNDTLWLRQNAPHLFQDIVESKQGDANPFEWGDFPWGGATFVEVGDLILPCAVSALKEVEDDAVAKLLGGLIGATILKMNHPDEFA